MKILVINAGSSSLKYQLIDMETTTALAKGNCDRIGLDGVFKHKTDRADIKKEVPMKTHADAIKTVIGALTDPEIGCISDLSEIKAIGHRIVSGGDIFNQSVLVTEEVIEGIDKCCELAPLHNPAHLIGIRACIEVMGDVPQVVVFDTAFHSTMPPKAYMYALPYKYYEQYKVRRYGAHGTSHKYVSLRAAAMLGKRPEELKIVTCHLGNGSSISAVDRGVCIDTSMGFTPLAGLMMGTRCGDIDPAVVTYLMEKENIPPKEFNRIMNKESGILAISGVSSDFRDIDNAIEEGNPRAKIALDMFEYQVTKFIGAYAAAMGGLDAIVFTAGVGENNPDLRVRCCAPLKFMGVEMDEEKNRVRGEERIVSSENSKIKVLVVPTNEELMIAADTEAIVSAL